jgi:flavin reductase (DIM6/NTAB) family NADH-FMN oxidoreductase RutF
VKKSLGPRTIIYPTPALILGAYDKQGKPCGMTVAWAGICCSSPPCIAVSLRKATYTYGCIQERQAFTVNVPSEKHVREVDYFGIVSGRKVDKFTTSGLTPVKSDLVDAPYILEFPFTLECRLLHTIEIGLHTQFIGEIMDIKADEIFLSVDGNLDIEKVKPILYGPENGYYFGLGTKLGKAFSIGKK